jgi:hypothetical protein
MNRAETHRCKDTAQSAGLVLEPVVVRTRRVLEHCDDDFSEDYPMIAALYETHQAHCLQQQALAEIRGDDPSDADYAMTTLH